MALGQDPGELISACSNAGINSLASISQAVSVDSSLKLACSPAVHSPPTRYALGLHFHQQDAAVGGAAKTGFKWADQRHADFTENYAVDLHGKIPPAILAAKLS